MPACDFCLRPGAASRCTRCNVARYCGRDCQRAHFKEHKQDCPEPSLQVAQVPALLQRIQMVMLPGRLRVLRRCLRVLEPASADWVEAQIALGDAFLDFVDGDRSIAMEGAIEAYTAALGATTLDQDPVRWGSLHNCLGMAFSERSEGSDNYSVAAEHFRLGLSVISQDADPLGWARVQTALANVLSLGGDNATALLHFQASLGVLAREEHPEDWGMAHINLGHTYADQGGAEGVAKALEHYGHSLEVFTEESHPVNWVMARSLIAGFLLDPQGAQERDPALAIEHLQAALRVYTREAALGNWASTHTNLGLAYSLLQPPQLESSIAHYEAALAGMESPEFAAESSEVDETHSESALRSVRAALARVIGQRTEGERTENVARALALFEASLGPLASPQGERVVLEGEEALAAYEAQYDVLLAEA